jgi:hypothetical protein
LNIIYLYKYKIKLEKEASALENPPEISSPEVMSTISDIGQGNGEALVKSHGGQQVVYRAQVATRTRDCLTRQETRQNRDQHALYSIQQE